MIEVVSETRCILCNKCVQICPMNVFDAVKKAPPIIARQSDCQTCYMCELYCPVDALYVAPEVAEMTSISERSIEASGFFGSLFNKVFSSWLKRFSIRRNFSTGSLMPRESSRRP